MYDTGLALQIALVDIRQRLVVDRRLKGLETLVDGQQFDDRRPGVDEILEGIADLSKSRRDLLEDTVGDGAGNDGRCHKEIDEKIVGLQIERAGNIEIQIVKIEREIISS